MIIRSAVLEGSVTEANRAAFDRHMRETVLSAIATYPGLREVRLRHPVTAESGAPPVHVVFDLYFDSLTDMDAALASPVRAQVRETIAAVMPMFDGRVYHLVMDEREVLVGSR
jgi:uncharacterized protein (TIGR02118 family)